MGFQLNSVYIFNYSIDMIAKLWPEQCGINNKHPPSRLAWA